MNHETTLLRQVHPDFIPDGQLTSQAFMPFPKDDGQLSAYDGDQISAPDSYRHYTEVLGNKSDSVWGITCAEVAGAGLTSASAPLENFPSHSLIDFTGHPEKNFRKLAKKLKVFATARGRLYSPQ
jgi:hypothetical protein